MISDRTPEAFVVCVNSYKDAESKVWCQSKKYEVPQDTTARDISADIRSHRPSTRLYLTEIVGGKFAHGVGMVNDSVNTYGDSRLSVSMTS